MTGTTTSPFGDLIYAYTRADAIADGVLIPVPEETSKEAGITWPVAVSSSLWSLVEPDNLEDMPGQSVQGRLWDLLWLFRCAISSGKASSDRTVTVIAHAGPGDMGEPVITLMLPEDD
jgi:hypothetical protein